MKEFPKIQSIYKRHDSGENKGKFIEDAWSLPEFEYLKDNVWVWTEKIDGTNIRVIWEWKIQEGGSEVLRFGGKTDNAQIPVFLLDRLQEIFYGSKMLGVFSDTDVCLYGEGYGARIQKGGGNYISNGVDFILFDVLIGSWWLKREVVEDIADKLGIKVVPIVGEGTIDEAISLVKGGIKSTFGDFEAEGLVLKPKVELFARNGHRIITKMKGKDWK